MNTAANGTASISAAGRRVSLRAFVGIYLAGSLCILTIAFLNVRLDDAVDPVANKLEAVADLLGRSLADYAGVPLSQTYDWVRANDVIRRLTADQPFRVQVFDRHGRLTGDTRIENSRGLEVTAEELPTIWFGSLWDPLENGWFGSERRAAPENAHLYTLDEQGLVFATLNGWTQRRYWLNAQDKLVISVSAPIRRVRTVLGAVVVSESGDAIERRLAKIRRDAVLRTMLVLALGLFACVSVFRAYPQRLTM